MKNYCIFTAVIIALLLSAASSAQAGNYTVYYYDDTLSAGYVWPLPQDSSDWFGVRFSSGHTAACSLKVVRVRLDGTSTQGTPDLRIAVFADDGNGLPGVELATETVSYANLPTDDFGWAEADFSAHGLVFGQNQEFHIGFSTVGGAGDTLYLLTDNGAGPHAGEDRSEARANGTWYLYSSLYGNDYVFMVEADVESLYWYAIPTLSEWGLYLLVAMLVIATVYVVRRKRKVQAIG